MAALHGAVLNSVDHLKTWYDLAAGKGLNLKFVVGQLGHKLANEFGATKERVERLGPARRLTPSNLGHRLCDSWCSDRGRDCACGGRTARPYEFSPCYLGHRFPPCA